MSMTAAISACCFLLLQCMCQQSISSFIYCALRPPTAQKLKIPTDSSTWLSSFMCCASDRPRHAQKAPWCSRSKIKKSNRLIHMAIQHHANTAFTNSGQSNLRALFNPFQPKVRNSKSNRLIHAPASTNSGQNNLQALSNPFQPW